MHKSLYWGLILLIASCTVQKEKDFEDPALHRYHAAFEEPADAKTRVYVDSDLRVHWNEGDHISIFERTTYNREFEFLGDTGDTAGDFDPVGSSHTGGDIGDGYVYAIYPYDKKNECDYDGKMTVPFPRIQHYKEDSFGIGANIMVAKTSTTDLRFMHVGGYRTVRLYGAGVSVSSIKLESNGPEYLSGRTNVTIGSDGKPSVSFIENTPNSKVVELVCDTPVALGSTAEEYVEFWFVLPPGTLSQGFTVTITDIDGNEYTKSTSKSVEIKSGVKKNMAAFEVVLDEPSVSLPEPVDLGLSVKWASFNLGASAPEEYGDYYAWGEIEPYYISQDPLIWKSGKDAGYSWSSYQWCMGSNKTITKYCSNSSYGYNGFTDSKTVLDPEDDAAHVNLGGKWRMPTDAEWTELRENCTWTRTTQNGVNGRLVTASNGNSIFLPAAGSRDNADLRDVGSDGNYWSSSLDTGSPYDAWRVLFYSDYVRRLDNYRYFGFSVRPVYDLSIPVESVSLDKSHLDLVMGDHATLAATVLPENATNKSVTWSSSNTSVAIVPIDGIVTGVGLGTATITVTTADGGKTATCTVTVKSVNTPEAVDLGLSVKWASFNLGASKPEEYGYYYAWGETEPYYSSLDPLTWKSGKNAGYSWPSYQWCMGSETTMTKYCSNSDYGYNGFTDTKTVLDPEDDAAHVNLGDSWRMPTEEEWTELRESCTWTWTTLNGIDGYLVSASNGNSIFLPPGDMYHTGLYNVGERGYYWSSSLNTDYPYGAWFVHFTSNRFLRFYSDRCFGSTVRPVSE